MLHAVEAPVLKLAAVAGAALMVGVFDAPEPDHAVTQRLELHAPSRPRAIYESVFNHGDIHVRLGDGKARPLTFQKRSYHYGCEWLSVEHLIPDGPNRYLYTYDEWKLRCDPTDIESIATPRKGYVLVVDTD